MTACCWAAISTQSALAWISHARNGMYAATNASAACPCHPSEATTPNNSSTSDAASAYWALSSPFCVAEINIGPTPAP
ncbi:Uncharacterised protein [Mycobacterium tuberculosis]|nr:Uncharacterised protein [Mycobacterium tuberculosis]CKQ68109.1 Uncharacterised protein [Mycobacterium tuberculosis]CKQ84281.1 Uncharacterised protein [Mycobacterium tuberculosis]CKX04291.1 Uncharacterised protein [Mycobacterium tuberculosis]CKY43717.1 Uncharacterised protein [Mycobacterium tuberculosis]